MTKSALKSVICSPDMPMKDKNEKIVLFGSSGLGQAYVRFLLKSGFSRVYFCDNNLGLPSEIAGIPRLAPAKLIRHHRDATIIITSSYWREIARQLHDIGMGDCFLYVDKTGKGEFVHRKVKVSQDRTKPSTAIHRSTCPICKRKSGNFFMNNGSRDLFLCQSCGHIFSIDFMDAEEFEAAYQGIGYFKQNCMFQGITSIEEGWQWDTFCDTRMRALREFGISFDSLSGAYVMEVGCLEGRFLYHLKTAFSCTVLGVDVNREIADNSLKTLGIRILAENIETTSTLEENAFDLILMFHLLEHVRCPVELVQKLYRSLRQKGRIVIEVPDGQTELRTPDHYHFFSEDSLRKALATQFYHSECRRDHYIDRAGVRRGSLKACARK